MLYRWKAGDTGYLVVLLRPNKDTEGVKDIILDKLLERFAVFVRRARVLPGPLYATRNLWFLRLFGHRHPVVSTRNFYWEGTGWYENSTRWKSCKPVFTRGHGAWA